MVNVGIFNKETSHSKSLLLSSSKIDVSKTNAITRKQEDTIREVNELYTKYLAQKDYQLISGNYSNYLTLLVELRSIKFLDPKLKLLKQIAEEGLIGSVNSVALYSQYAYKEISMLSLNNKITEILSNKNVQSMVTSATGNISATQKIQLSPLFSNYIKIYGLPAFGVGFDPIKLAFLQKIQMNL